MKLTPVLMPNWPSMAWLAQFERGGDQVVLRHGPLVEIAEDWFAEAVWDGPFTNANFDRTDLVFGSAGRKRDGDWIFVSSGTTVDRLHWHERGGEFHLSNSLPCILQALNTNVDPHFADYFGLFESIIQGLEKYCRTIKTSAGDVHLTYFRNLKFDGQSLVEIEKPFIHREFAAFADYDHFLSLAMQAIGDNLADANRHTSLKPIASISTGYDSPTAAAVARHAGLKETLSIVDARCGANDDGSEIARCMGLKPIKICRNQWRTSNEAELDARLFIASDAKGEDVYFAPAANILQHRVLFTGYSGSRIWDKNVADYTNIRRGDQSGLSHTEPRLHAGYFHVPLPFFAALQENDLRALGATQEMQPWSIGGDYDRPLCRRIVEAAGVPREYFGQQKKAASILLFDRESFLPPDQLAEFTQWMADHHVGSRTTTERFSSAIRARVRTCSGRVVELAQRSGQAIDSVVKIPILSRLAHSGRIHQFARHEVQFDHLFPWAVSEAMKSYQHP